MQFQTVPLAAAEGAILAHGFRAGEKVFRKGRALTAHDVIAIAAAGMTDVTVARLDIGDVPEDEAAARIAAAMVGEGVRAGAAFTGRANLYATTDGLAVIDAAA